MAGTGSGPGGRQAFSWRNRSSWNAGRDRGVNHDGGTPAIFPEVK